MSRSSGEEREGERGRADCLREAMREEELADLLLLFALPVCFSCRILWMEKTCLSPMRDTEEAMAFKFFLPSPRPFLPSTLSSTDCTDARVTQLLLSPSHHLDSSFSLSLLLSSPLLLLLLLLFLIGDLPPSPTFPSLFLLLLLSEFECLVRSERGAREKKKTSVLPTRRWIPASLPSVMCLPPYV